jgi:fatty acid-binding protein DegV
LHIVNGRIEPLEKVRTRQRAVERMFEIMREYVANGSPVWGAATHTNCPDEATRLEETLRERFGCDTVLTADAGPTIGTHAGPGVLGIATCPVNW